MASAPPVVGAVITRETRARQQPFCSGSRRGNQRCPRPVATVRRHGIDANVRRGTGAVRLDIERVHAVAPDVEKINDRGAGFAVFWPRLGEHDNTRRRCNHRQSPPDAVRPAIVAPLTRATQPTPSQVNALAFCTSRAVRASPSCSSQRCSSYFDCRAGSADNSPSAPRNATKLAVASDQNIRPRQERRQPQPASYNQTAPECAVVSAKAPTTDHPSPSAQTHDCGIAAI